MAGRHPGVLEGDGPGRRDGFERSSSMQNSLHCVLFPPGTRISLPQSMHGMAKQKLSSSNASIHIPKKGRK